MAARSSDRVTSRECRAAAAERGVRSVLHRLGYRFRLHRTALPGPPQVVLPRWHLAVFVVDCARHPHPDCAWGGASSVPATAAARRLAQAVTELERQGWQTLIVQACEADDPDTLGIRLDVALQGRLIATPAGGKAPQRGG